MNINKAYSLIFWDNPLKDIVERGRGEVDLCTIFFDLYLPAYMILTERPKLVNQRRKLRLIESNWDAGIPSCAIINLSAPFLKRGNINIFFA